jgi:hypothetical protein
MGECGEKIYDGKWLWMLLDIYRINWHIRPPYVARARQIPSLRGGLIAKGVLYARFMGQRLVITYPPIRRVDSSYISGASPTFQVLQPTIYPHF